MLTMMACSLAGEGGGTAGTRAAVRLLRRAVGTTGRRTRISSSPLSTLPVAEDEEGHHDDDHDHEDGRPASAGGGGGGALGSLKPIYVAATRQHVGKTSTSLALISGLHRRFDRVGYIKPIGQQCVDVVERGSPVSIKVDKDAALIKDHFKLDHISYRDASPVVIPPGYVRDYLDGKITLEQQQRRILDSFGRVADSSDVVLCEGTGHCAVGSVVGACNAQVSSWLGAKMVLVANGGLGAAFDELELNRALCEKHGVDIAGVIINKVKMDKLDQTREYVSKAMARYTDIPVLGFIPDRPFLGCPALADLERLFPGSSLISGLDHRLRHYHVHDVNLVATSLNVFLRNLRILPPRTLYVCHASRNDILLGFLMEARQQQMRGVDWQAGLVVTGCEEFPISSQVLEIVTSADKNHQTCPPILLCPQTTRRTMSGIYGFTPKLNFEDGHRVATTVRHYEPHIDFDLLLERVGYDSSSNSSAAAADAGSS